ncbi:conserved Plasmodium protein, unknown function [Plasmodium gallinaceum]|uniref:Amine oxidase domain-containing protein n=1 Tax=Plasmodium gallinaceum TaxID=5849 RepID=A0A1J1H164_PLAGA|nr:conserved Plasmodium protein, unknown function [Plasmodium gallinaceum]CRG98197.1 conserved Plasmodium protein, unknown function [Plasmodium gallinaceum]
MRMGKTICLIGNGIDSLCLAYFMQRIKLRTHILLIKKKCNYINTYFHDSNIIENGCYSFILSENSKLFPSLLMNLNIETKILERNKYSNNISYLDENGNIYKINKFLFRIFYYFFKDYFFNKTINIEKSENLHSFSLKYFDKEICENLIFPYCYHYFNYSPQYVLMNSYFPNLMKEIKDKKSLIKSLLSCNKNNSIIFSKNKKIFTFKDGNEILTKKLIENLELSDDIKLTNNINNLQIKSKKNKVKIFLGRKVLKCKKVVFCLNPLELKNFLKKSKLENKKKNIIIKYLSNFRTTKIKITNVCFKKNVLPFSYSLESLLLIKKNEKNKLISLLYDNNIFPQFNKNISEKKNSEEDIFETSLRFLSKEQNDNKSINEINDFLQNILKVKEKPDLVISNNYDVFSYNEKFDKIFKKLINKHFRNVKIFWAFSFFKNFEFCLSEAKSFFETNI